MAACRTTTIGSSSFSVVRSNGRPQSSPSSLCCCCCRVSHQPISFGRLGDRHLASKKETRAPRRKPWAQITKLQLQLQYSSSSPPPSLAAADVSSSSSDPATAELSNESQSESGGMSIEERNAIMEFEGLSIDSISEEEEEEEEEAEEGGRPSESSLELSAEARKEGQPAQAAIKKSEEEEEEEEDAAKVQRRRRSEMYESAAAPVVKGRGASIANIITLFVGLLDRPFASDGKMIAGAGSAVLEKVEEEVGKLQAVEDVDGQHLFEVLRVVKLLQMDLQLIAAARKDSTMFDRLSQTKAHCRQVLNILAIL